MSESIESMLEAENWHVDATVPPLAAEEAAPSRLTSGRIIEAMLFVGGSPLTSAQACQIIRGLSEAQFVEAIEALNHDYRRQQRPYAIEPHGKGYVLALRPRYRGILDKLYHNAREARLSTPAVDVLALVAYRQPITKAEVDTLRGAESGALLRQLLRRGLLHLVPRTGQEKREAYATTPRFLEVLGLQSLDELPRTHDLQQI